MRVDELIELLGKYGDDQIVYVPRHNSNLTYGLPVDSVSAVTHDEVEQVWIE